MGTEMPDENEPERSALTSRFQQMFPVLTATEIDRIRHFGEVRRFHPGEMLSRGGRPSLGMLVILSGRAVVLPRDALGRELPLGKFAQLVGATLDDMDIVPGEVVADLAQLS
jgi:thioredoxin reductase (NADPH)